MAGVMLILMGAAKLSSVIKFIPHPVIVGFTSGIAVIILSRRGERLLLGLHMASVPSDVHPEMARVHRARRLRVATRDWCGAVDAWRDRRVAEDQSTNPRSVRRARRRHARRDRDACAGGNDRLTVWCAGDRAFPAPRLPAMSLATMNALLVPAFTIAMLAAIESLLSAVVADGMIGGRHRSNMELVAQGVANIGSALFGGIPATGAIARTATNVKNGGRTPIAYDGARAHACQARDGILRGSWASLHSDGVAGRDSSSMVAYHMSEWRTFAAELSVAEERCRGVGDDVRPDRVCRSDGGDRGRRRARGRVVHQTHGDDFRDQRIDLQRGRRRTRSVDAPGDSPWRRGIPDHRPAVLRRRRIIQGDSGHRRGEAARARDPDARRFGARFDGHACIEGRRPSQPPRRDACAARGSSGATRGRAEWIQPPRSWRGERAAGRTPRWPSPRRSLVSERRNRHPRGWSGFP